VPLAVGITTVARVVSASNSLEHDCSWFVSGIHGVGGLGQIGRVNRLFAVIDNCLSVFLNILECRVVLFRDSLCEILRSDSGAVGWDEFVIG
jgi:hypothetical protein